MFFARFAVAALSIGAAVAAPINGVVPKIGDISIPAGVPTIVSRAISVTDALAAVKGAAQDLKSDIGSLSPIDGAKVIQLASEIDNLNEWINVAKSTIPSAHDVVPSVDLAGAMLAIEQVGKKLQSVPWLKTTEALAGPVTSLTSTVEELTLVLSSLPLDSSFDDVRQIAKSLPAHFSL